MQGRIPDNAVRDLCNDHNNAPQAPRSSLDVPPSHYDTERERDVESIEVVYTEHQARSERFYQGDFLSNKPASRRHDACWLKD